MPSSLLFGAVQSAISLFIQLIDRLARRGGNNANAAGKLLPANVELMDLAQKALQLCLQGLF